MQTVYMPRDFDEEVWRDAPDEWLPELIARGKLREDGTAEFFVADILGTVDAEIDEDRKIKADIPEGADFIAMFIDNDPADQSESLNEIEERFQGDYWSDDDFPMECFLVFWRHHQKAQTIKVREPVSSNGA